MSEKIPVLFLIFKRLETTLEAFKPIASYKPNRLYIAADGPRDYVKNEKEECESLRKKILELVDWECEVKTLFREKNLGCTQAVNDGISWFFENEQYGIINEDDIVLSKDFFLLCEELLPMYKDDERIMMISSQNHSGRYLKSNKYVFNLNANIWGWATWNRAWAKMDLNISNWKKVKKLNLIQDFGLFKGIMFWRNYHYAYNDIEKGSWDTRWGFVVWNNKGLVATPLVNLSKNVGIGGDGGAHYTQDDVDPYQHLEIGHLERPYVHPEKIEVDSIQNKEDRKDYFRFKMVGFKKILKKIFRH